MSNILHIEFDGFKKQYLLGEEIKGQLFLTSTKDIDFKEFGINIVIESRGKVGFFSKIIKKEIVLKNKLILKNEDYYFPISFHNNKFESYFGINVNFVLKIETYGIISEKFVNEPLKPFINPFNLFDVNKQWKESLYLKFYSKKTFFDIKESFISLDNEKIFHLLLGAIIFCFFGFIILINTKEVYYFSIVPLIAFLSLSFYLLAATQFFGDFKAKLNTIENNKFKVKIYSTKNWKFIKNIQIYYVIREEVIDKRGTSDTTLTETIFESKANFLTELNGNIETEFSFPENKPISFELGDSRIYWNLKIDIKSSFGIQFTYQAPFTTFNKNI